MDRISIPMLQDNYCHLLIDRASASAVAIDPSEASPLIDFLFSEGLKLSAIWNTHHHWDHTGGNHSVAEQTKCEVVGAKSDRNRIPGITRTVQQGDIISFAGEEATVMENPGHTTGAISFFMQTKGNEPPHVYTGDTLFLGGCGRLFEGSPEMMWQSMLDLRQLPPETMVHCGHEYTLSNLRFAQHLEPDNHEIHKRLERVEDLRKKNLATVPAPLETELKTNPFLRADDSKLIESISKRFNENLSPGVEAFAFIRGMKDMFKG
jgi:hydroxyacylglutathione hydrolase